MMYKFTFFLIMHMDIGALLVLVFGFKKRYEKST